MLKKIAKELRNLADKIEAGNSNLTEEEAMALLSTPALCCSTGIRHFQTISIP